MNIEACEELTSRFELYSQIREGMDDIMRAADYIGYTLRNPDTADNLSNAVPEQIGSLADLPQMFCLVDDPILASIIL